MINGLVFPWDEQIVQPNDFKNISYGADVLGYQVLIRLSYYRSLPLSCIEQVRLTVDGQKVPDEKITFCLNNKRFTLAQLCDLYGEWWNVLSDATLEVEQAGGLCHGSHEVEVKLLCRTPYIFFEGDYARRLSQNKKTLHLLNN